MLKKILLYLVVAIVFVGIVVLVLVKVFAPSPTVPSVPGDPFKVVSNPPENETQSPEEFAEAAFRWYLGESTNDYRYPLTEAFRMERTNWFSPRFIEFWDNPGNDSGVDLLYGAQDVPLSWVQSINATVREESASRAVVSVSLGSGEDLVIRHITLARNGEGQWRIDQVTDAE